MKKLLFVLCFSLLCVSAFSQIYRYRSSTFAFGERNSRGIIVWGDWERASVLITIDTDRDYIKVYSDRDQNYVIVNASDEYTDDDGGTSIDFDAVDEEGLECTVRLRVDSGGSTQLYAYYNDIAWVYSGLKRY